MRETIRAVQAAFAFLTTFPVSTQTLTADDFARAARWFPLVGLVLGGMLAGMAWLLAPRVPALLGAALVLTAWITATGALHHDGFADCADALLAPVPPERRLVILRDTHVGAFALVAVPLLLLLAWSALATLWASPMLPRVLGAAPFCGRLAMLWAQCNWRYARPQGMGRLVAPRRSDRVWVIAWGLALLPLGRMMVLVGGMACVLGHWLAGRMAARLGGGLTGDTYGALNVLVETATLVLAALVLA